MVALRTKASDPMGDFADGMTTRLDDVESVQAACERFRESFEALRAQVAIRRSHHVSWQGALHLAKALEASHSTLEYLNLRGNRIHDIGAKAVFKALTANKKLHTLVLWANNLTSRRVPPPPL